MKSEPLIKAIIAAMMLLEESGPDEVDPDTAVRGLESIGYELLQLTGSDRSEFLELVERMASESADSHASEFLRSLPFSIGMTE